MTNLLRFRLNHSLLALAVFAAFTPQAIKAQAPHCSMGNLVMNGTYVMSGNGTIVGVGPVVMVGQAVYNGDGAGVLSSVTKNVNGMVVRATSVPVVFTVNPDCTGSKIVGGSGHFDFVITPDGNTITWVQTDTNAVISGKAERSSR